MWTPSRLRLGIAIFAFALAGGVEAADARRDLEVGVQITGQEIRSRATMFVPASQQRVWDVVTDYERAPQFTQDLEESKILSRAGNRLRVFQKNRFRLGPFSFPVETVRDIRLTAPVRFESRLVEGSMKEYDAVTELVPEAGGTRIVYRSRAIPDSILAGFATESVVKRETEEHFRQLRVEILRRERVASAHAQTPARH
jgi:hypothetical protein